MMIAKRVTMEESVSGERSVFINAIHFVPAGTGGSYGVGIAEDVAIVFAAGVYDVDNWVNITYGDKYKWGYLRPRYDGDSWAISPRGTLTAQESAHALLPVPRLACLKNRSLTHPTSHRGGGGGIAARGPGALPHIYL